MSYYKLLGLVREPFSSSPDPEFFYQSCQHRSALMRLMAEIRLKQGMSLIIGDVGVGKTTLLRKALQMFSERPDIISAMMLDPAYEDERAFLNDVIRTFKIEFKQESKVTPGIAEYKAAIKDFLFQKGVTEAKTIVLLIDEAQKLNPSSLEALRTLLNFETNEYKLLQLVLLAQFEIIPKLKQMQNLLDRINLKFLLKPLNIKEAGELINFRLFKAGVPQDSRLFSDEAIQAIYEASGGYPRKITRLCHHALEAAVMYDLSYIDSNLIQDLTSVESMVLNV